MTLRAWRIVKARHAASAFGGEGARRFGGRWNSKGTAMVYTAGSPALAVLEMLVHLDAHEILSRFVLIEVTFRKSLVRSLAPKDLPADWRSDPAPRELRAIGDRWAGEGRSAVLRVPSALVETEENYLLNPLHPDFPKIGVGPPQAFTFDPRLLKATYGPSQ